ncbi:TonB-dependent receptor PqqU [Larkinella knui]|uniref:TonB-dependent receptor n=1 Tax=Larkinella knui TaxID=2025310 RepID=A0A3P1CWH7_9BACT|nr:TonB-dependent receptor [Larkinella knui]RRB17762.1 TonB-dependent receptor [Larkinella knui]
MIRYSTLFVLISFAAYAQQPETGRSVVDSIQLSEVTVRGYETNRPLLETAASVNVLSGKELNQRFGSPTLVPAFNTLPGVRMDERSPGSYRLSIRGSLIRSPFGVRNVKIYWNELPMTDAGGTTYLNALDVRSIGRVEVIKGPSGSLYGAGTGGTVLLSGSTSSLGESANRAEVSALAGSYGLSGQNYTFQTGKNNSAISLNYGHLQSDGYRVNSRMYRDNLALNATFAVNPKQTVSVMGLYSDLMYQTPGGLTQAQFLADPRQARPSTRVTPGSVDQRAAIYQKTGYLGFSHQYRWNDRIQNTTVIFGSLTDFANPFITNYEKRADQGIGGRTVTKWQLVEEGVPTQLVFGGEWQQNFTVDRNYGNRRGRPDTLQADDELRASQTVLFAQLEATLPLGIIATAGLSRNEVAYGFTRFSVQPVVAQPRGFQPVWLPRVALLKKIGESISVFASVSTGYSAPTIQEVRPSEGTFNPTLEPERGTNLEAAVRGQLNRFQFDVAVYQFRLRQTIVRRSVESGAEYFINAGATNQKGLEAQVAYNLIVPKPGSFWRSVRIWNSTTVTNYRFKNYQQGTADVSGNRVTGVPPLVVVTGFDAETRAGLYAHLTHQFIDKFPLDDANAFKSDIARMLNATVGFRKVVAKRWTLDAYLSGDNLLDQTYSLGYDLNAFGGRFYNAAPRRNVTGGVKVGVRW